MKVYVSGSYKHKIEIVRLVNILDEALPNFISVSTWLGDEPQDEASLTLLDKQACIDEDVADIDRCDVFLLINKDTLSTYSPGRWIEYGVAMAFSKVCVIWGDWQPSLFLDDENTVWLRNSDQIDDLVLVLQAIQAMLNVGRDKSDVYRTDKGRASVGTGEGTEPYLDEDSGEAAREGILYREGSPLSHAIGKAWRRAVGTRGIKEGAGE